MVTSNIASTASSSALTLDEDRFGADESGVRWDLVMRVREAIRNGTYDMDSKVDAMLDRLSADVTG